MASYSRYDPDTGSVKIIPDVKTAGKYPVIDTLEGRVQPLILGETLVAQALEMPAGLIVPEHTEPRESMIYTLRGRWVLYVNGAKHVMTPGSLYWIREGTIMSCEVPVDESAEVLSFVRTKASVQTAITDCARDVIVVSHKSADR